MTKRAVIGLGSNIDPEENIQTARAILAKEFDVIAESEFIQTKPVGYTDQDDFINGAVYVETDLSIGHFVKTLKRIEKDMGRKRSQLKSGPRSIDLDLVVYDGEILDQDFYERDFLKNSVLELIPDLEY